MQASKQVLNKCNEHDGNHAAINKINLASINVDHEKNRQIAYRMEGSMTKDIEGERMVPSDVICRTKNLKFSQPRGNKPTMESAMTSEFGNNLFCNTELEDGIECKNITSDDGNLDVHPSTYPTGCPNNYSILLNKIHTQS